MSTQKTSNVSVDVASKQNHPAGGGGKVRRRLINEYRRQAGAEQNVTVANLKYLCADLFDLAAKWKGILDGAYQESLMTPGESEHVRGETFDELMLILKYAPRYAEVIERMSHRDLASPETDLMRDGTIPPPSSEQAQDVGPGEDEVSGTAGLRQPR